MDPKFYINKTFQLVDVRSPLFLQQAIFGVNYFAIVVLYKFYIIIPSKLAQDRKEKKLSILLNGYIIM